MTPRPISYGSFCQDVWEGRLDAMTARLQEGGVFEKGAADSLLVEAAEHGQLAALNLLLPYANPLYNGSLALIKAAHGGYQEVVARLLEVAEHESTDLKGAFFTAALNLHDSVVACLAPRVGVVDVFEYFARDSKRWSAADRLASYIPLEVLELTLKDKPAHEFPISRPYLAAARLAENLSSTLVSPAFGPENVSRPRL